ncbi:g5539 [Coccomyxa elongata]
MYAVQLKNLTIKNTSAAGVQWASRMLVGVESLCLSPQSLQRVALGQAVRHVGEVGEPILWILPDHLHMYDEDDDEFGAQVGMDEEEMYDEEEEEDCAQEEEEEERLRWGWGR